MAAGPAGAVVREGRVATRGSGVLGSGCAVESAGTIRSST